MKRLPMVTSALAQIKFLEQRVENYFNRKFQAMTYARKTSPQVLKISLPTLCTRWARDQYKWCLRAMKATLSFASKFPLSLIF